MSIRIITRRRSTRESTWRKGFNAFGTDRQNPYLERSWHHGVWQDGYAAAEVNEARKVSSK